MSKPPSSPESGPLSRVGRFFEEAVEKIGWGYKLADRRNVALYSAQGKRIMGVSLAHVIIAFLMTLILPRRIFWFIVIILVVLLVMGWRFRLERKPSR